MTSIARVARDSAEDAFGSFTSDWDIITMEDVIIKRHIRHRIQTAVLKAVDGMITLRNHQIEREASVREINSGNEEMDASNHDDDDDDELDVHRPRREVEKSPACVKGFLFPLKTFHLLQDRTLLPENHGRYRLKYELDENRLIVGMASPAHDAAANAWNGTITLWSSNFGLGVECLRQMGQGQWKYLPGADKSPDQSFVPVGISIPPAILIPGTLALAYPTMVFEISKTHESSQDLMDDAHHKHFSPQTSVRVWLGIKLYDGYGGRMRCMFRIRDPLNNGYLPNSGATTGYISLHQPTTIQFIIPKMELLWGVAPPLPATPFSIPGANALPPPPVPGVPTDDLILPLENVRLAALAAW